MGSLIYLQKLYKMKLLILSFLVSVSLAEPEADPQYLYGHHFGYSHLGYGYAGYPYTTAYYGKREADAEPEALYYGYGYGHHLGYSHLGYGYAGYPYTTTYYGKREAEAEPQYFGYRNYGYGG